MKTKHALLLELKKFPMLVASLDGDDLPFLLEEAKTARADIVEIRMDLWGDFLREGLLDKMTRFKDKIGLPMLISFRGGHPFPAWWQPLHWRALPAGSMIDVEWNPKYPWADIRRFARQQHLALIISHHDYEATPPARKLFSLAQALTRKGADIVKIATKANSDADVRTLLDLAARIRGRQLVTVMGMGRWGAVSRLSAPVFGSCLTYGFIGTPTAVGQYPYRELLERMRTLNPLYETGFQERQKKRGVFL